MPQIISFTAAARLIYQMGEQLISNEKVALLELIKNGYDADATEVEVFVDTEHESQYGKGLVSIRDNGNGMTPTIVEEAFLKLSTNFKEIEKITPYFNRRVVGSKGVGRLAVQKLGTYVEVITQPRIKRLSRKNLITGYDEEKFENSNCARIRIDWDQFLKKEDFASIEAEVEYYNRPEKKYGTIINIYGVKNPSKWDLSGYDANSFRNEILRMTNVFSTHKLDSFTVELDINGRKISNINVDENMIRETCHSYVEFSYEDWVLNIDIFRKNIYLDYLAEKIINNMENNNYELLEFNDKWPDDMKRLSFRIDLSSDDFKSDFPRYKDIEFEFEKEDTWADPGSFAGVVYATDKSSSTKKHWKDQISKNKLSKYGIRLASEFESAWEQAQGVYLFRDQFRILPYGDSDWLDMTSFNTRQSDVVFKEHNVAGYITLEGETSEGIQEQTNREGLVENEFGSNFFKIIRDIAFNLIMKSDSSLREGFKVKKSDESIRSTKNELIQFKSIEVDDDKNEMFEKINSKLNQIAEDPILLENKPVELLSEIKNDVSVYRNKEIQMEKKYKQVVFEREQELEEIRSIYPLVGQGMVLETLTHELSRIDTNIKGYATQSITELENEVVNRELIANKQRNIIDQTYILRDHLDHFEPTSSKQYSKFSTFDIGDFLRGVYTDKGPIASILDDNEIEFIVEGNYKVKASKGLLITVFDNLILNSVYWLKNKKISSKKIRIKVRDNGVISFFDNGPGIHPEIESDLFEPFKSMKKDGRGLGLYICKELLALNSASIRLSSKRNTKGRIRTFIIKFE